MPTIIGVQRAAAVARESRNHAVVGHQQAVNRSPADRGQAGRQADCRRMPRRSGEHLLSKLPLATRHPTADDRAGQLPDPSLGQRVRVGAEAAGERLAGRGRQRTQQAGDAVAVAPDHQRHLPAGGGPCQDRGVSR